jgi:RHH-type proline utilization regulon transcriptional repressor/proline dehydrogenase/delta 1-pyrroline-5-carboxylate dehydrogenase
MTTDNSRLNTSFLHIPFPDEPGLTTLANEQETVEKLLSSLTLSLPQNKIETLTKILIDYCRKNHSTLGLEALLQEYPLNSTEGMILMSLAEALLRIPDKSTALKLTREQFSLGDWSSHLHHHESWFVDFSVWGAVLSNKLLNISKHETKHKRSPPVSFTKVLTGLVSRLGEEVVISAVNQAIGLLGKQFVIAPGMESAVSKSHKYIIKGYRLTYDMLGEAAITEAESVDYLHRYVQAIEIPGIANANKDSSSSVSIKLSALNPRFEYLQKDQLYKKLFDALMTLCLLAKKYNIAITIDAEEIARFEITLVLLEMLLSQESLQGWHKLGIAVQTYHKRAPAILNQLLTFAKKYNKVIPVRLVKGAYWDYEIKLAQQQGLNEFPVFTHKINTELCYLVCTEKLFANSQYFYPQFATHNCQTIASIYYYAEKFSVSHYEFQQLYGMGYIVYEGLYQFLQTHNLNKIPCSIYAPVGEQKELLPYLVRRLIENGANNSFINQLYNQEIIAEDMIIDVREYYQTHQYYSNNHIPLAANLFQDRENSSGIDLSSSDEIHRLISEMQPYTAIKWQAGPLMYADHYAEKIIPIHDPTTEQSIGECELASEKDCHTAILSASKAFKQWKGYPADKRAVLLNTVADLIQQQHAEFVVLLAKEAGKTLADAVNEIREAIDFCRYYASAGRKQFETPVLLPGYTGEKNTLVLEARGIILCISPWNFPLSIFTGQLSAALMAGNCVLAKPASATSMIAYRIIALFYQAGFSKDVIQLLPASADSIEKAILSDPVLSAVAFTGSYQTARHINKLLASRPGPIIPLIAETGGINVMLADSSALSEQLVRDIVLSAFGSAGQRCSALRAVFIQDDVYQHVMQQISGAMQQLLIGDPLDFATDIGPLINQKAVNQVLLHIEEMRKKGLNIITRRQQKQQGNNFILPTLIELESFEQLTEEIFGPVLHVIRYHCDEIEAIIEQVNQTGFGLTFGLHSRIPSRIKNLADRINAGNIYINRNMTGAVVGVQPFGGHGLSGTGPKAGGPHYLQRFAIEKTITINTTSIGGNLQLLNPA